MKHAGMSATGQLPPDAPGLLVLGGFHLSEREVAHLEHAARALVALRLTNKPHIMGISLVVLGATVEGAASVGPGGVRLSPNGSTSPTMQLRNALNLSYAGRVEFSEDPHTYLRAL
jgi:hypothetical protein